MKTLDDQISDIEKLDEFRRLARRLRQEAANALTAKSYRPQPRSKNNALRAAHARRARRERPLWEPPGDDVEKAEMLRALEQMTPPRAGQENHRASRKAIIADLLKITLKDLSKKVLDGVPIFRSALVLQALAETSGYALHRTALICFYRVVQELNEVAPPAWTSGAARADPNAQATAFVTGECARALLALENALLQTATAAELLGREAARQARYSSDFPAWHKQEERFRGRALEISLGTLPRMIVPPAIAPKRGKRGAQRLLKDIVAALKAAPRIATLGLPPTKRPRLGDSIGAVASNLLTDAAAEIARNAVAHLLAAIKPSAGAGASDPEEFGKQIAKNLRAGAQVVRDLLRPLEQFAESVIDRQIAAASPHLGVVVDAAELTFAATLLGQLSDWNRPKVRAAYGVLQPLLSVNGRLLSIRPFDVGDKGYRLNVATLEVTRRLADLIARLDVEPELEFISRLLLPLEYTRMSCAEQSERGWMNDPEPREPKSLWWLTTIAFDALGAIVRMLDEMINRRVLRHFQVRRPTQLNLPLEDLFYPDYGQKSDSIAIKLQALRAHAGHGPVESKPAYSLILYGPPGTGKTTLVEAVAKTADVPLVEITPSDILVGGAEDIERRARQVFQALSKLTHVVILFDEFDSILLDRAKRDPEEIPTSMIEFLTPGMLPKLKALNEASKEGRVSYLLATNFVDRLDSAVTRGGRFDDKQGVYPPDVVSRLGRLLDQLKRMEITGPSLKNVHDVVRRTANGPMDKLGRPGWYTMPRAGASPSPGTPLDFANGGKDYKDAEAEAIYENELKKYVDQRMRRVARSAAAADAAAVRREAEKEPYWKQWKQITKWDEDFDKVSTDKIGWNQLYRHVAR